MSKPISANSDFNLNVASPASSPMSVSSTPSPLFSASSIGSSDSFSVFSPSISLDPPPAFSKRKGEFEEFVRRVTPRERYFIERKLEELMSPQHKEYTDYFLQGLLKAIGQKWGPENAFVSDEEMPYYALLAFKQGKIENFQLATLLYYWSAAAHHQEYYTNKDQEVPDFKPEVYAFFNPDGSVNKESVDLLFRTFLPSSEDPEDDALITLSDEEKRKWIEEVGKLPKSEQQFFRIPCLLEPLKEEGERVKTILEVFTEEKIFMSGIDIGEKERPSHLLLTSVGMKQAFINATHKAEGKTVKINPAIGFSSEADIRRNGLESTRDMALHFPGVELPSKADTFYAPWHYMTDHDAYHAKRSDDYGEKWRIQTVSLADGLGLDGTKEERRIQKEIQNQLNDMESSLFSVRAYTKEEVFWITFAIVMTLIEKPFGLLSPKTQEAVLRRIHHSMSRDPETAKCLKDGFNNLRRKFQQKENKAKADFLFGNRAFVRLSEIARGA